jgi:LysM repeat protein
VQDDSPTTPRGPAQDQADEGAARSSSEPTRPSRDPQTSPGPVACPFLRSIDERDTLGIPVGAPDPLNRCAALHDPVPQSLRQQELVCLTSGHVNCPRYMRGAPESVEVAEPVVAISLTTPAIAGSLLVLAAAFALSIVFVMNHGGLVLTAAAPTTGPTGVVLGDVEDASPDPTAVPAATSTAPSTPSPSQSAAPSTTATIAPSPSPSPSHSPSPSPTATVASPTPSPSPTAKPTKKPSSDRYALLSPCPDASKCYIYIIRSGDNLFSIARYFGVPLATVKTMNPWTADGLRAGRELRIPPPTR